MTYGRVLCQVVETPAHEQPGEFSAAGLLRGQDWPRDLLPWADPYIAVLMLRLERRYDWAGQQEDDFAADELAAEEAAFRAADDWREVSFHEDFFSETLSDDAFTPGWHERRMPMFPPMYGGFPLLDDVTDGLEEDPV